MNGMEESDPSIVPTKPTNKAGQPAAEPVEGSDGAKRNASRQNTNRTQCRSTVSQAQARIRQAVTRNRKEKLTALLHHISVDTLRYVFLDMKKNAAPGIDGVTWERYGEDLDRNLIDLHRRVHAGAYRAQPSRRKRGETRNEASLHRCAGPTAKAMSVPGLPELRSNAASAAAQVHNPISLPL